MVIETERRRGGDSIVGFSVGQIVILAVILIGIVLSCIGLQRALSVPTDGTDSEDRESEGRHDGD